MTVVSPPVAMICLSGWIMIWWFQPTPLKNDGRIVNGKEMRSHIWHGKEHVWNHQPVIICEPKMAMSGMLPHHHFHDSATLLVKSPKNCKLFIEDPLHIHWISHENPLKSTKIHWIPIKSQWIPIKSHSPFNTHEKTWCKSLQNVCCLQLSFYLPTSSCLSPCRLPSQAFSVA